MPIYAYRCEHCGESRDVMQKLSESPLTLCPSCGKDGFRRQLTAPAFQLKGSGWYVTDFRDNGKPKTGKSEGEGAPAGAGAAASAGKPADAAPSAAAAVPSASPASPAAPGGGTTTA